MHKCKIFHNTTTSLNIYVPFFQITLLALIAVATAAPQIYSYAAAPLYQPSYYGSPYAQPLLAKYAPAPQAPASTEHATHVAAATPFVYSAYNYVPAYSYAAAPGVSF